MTSSWHKMIHRRMTLRERVFREMKWSHNTKTREYLALNNKIHSYRAFLKRTWNRCNRKRCLSRWTQGFRWSILHLNCRRSDTYLKHYRRSLKQSRVQVMNWRLCFDEDEKNIWRCSHLKKREIFRLAILNNGFTKLMPKKSFIGYKENISSNQDSMIYFVWLSHKSDKSWEVLDAFCDSTGSWKLISRIVEASPNKSIYKTNLVKWAPLSDNKLRYPDLSEKMQWLQTLKNQIMEFQPGKVFLFWKHVSDFVLKNLETEKAWESEYMFLKSRLICIPHPSYMSVYRRKYIDGYIQDVINKITT